MLFLTAGLPCLLIGNGANLAQEEVGVYMVLDEVLATAGTGAALLQVGRKAGAAEGMATAGDKGIPEQGYADGAAEVIQELIEAGGGSDRAGVPLLCMAIDFQLFWLILLMIGRLLHYHGPLSTTIASGLPRLSICCLQPITLLRLHSIRPRFPQAPSVYQRQYSMVALGAAPLQ